MFVPREAMEAGARKTPSQFFFFLLVLEGDPFLIVGLRVLSARVLLALLALLGQVGGFLGAEVPLCLAIYLAPSESIWSLKVDLVLCAPSPFFALDTDPDPDLDLDLDRGTRGSKILWKTSLSLFPILRNRR